MTLKLYLHPLSSFCWKALTALYENDTPFEAVSVNLGDPGERAALEAMWPLAKIPVLKDEARDVVVPEVSIIIEYLDQHYPGRTRFIPADPDEARRTRLADRFYDLYVHMPMQAIVGDRLRPEGGKDPIGVDRARAGLATAYGMIEAEMATKTWARGETFTLADCAAAPALHYANRVHPFEPTHPNTAAYLKRLEARPSFARAMREAEPFRHMFPA